MTLRTVPGSAARRSAAVRALGGVRLLTGGLGLVAPTVLARRLDPDRPPSPAAIYAFRLFGVRTVLLGFDLLVRRDEELQRAVRQGVVIHSSDVVTAATLGVTRQVSPRTAILTTLISATNVALAVAALEPGR